MKESIVSAFERFSPLRDLLTAIAVYFHMTLFSETFIRFHSPELIDGKSRINLTPREKRLGKSD